MLIAIRRRRGRARFGAALAIASALAMALTGAPANAAASTAGVPKAFGTASPAGVIANGTYRWQNADGGGLCLTYDVESRGAARQESCATNDDFTVFWDAVNTSGNNYELINEHNGQCLSISGGSSADGAAAFVFTCAGTADQIFTLVPATSTIFAGAYELMNVNSGKCVAVGGARTNKGAWVIQWTCDPSGAFMWRPI
jgi:hypothetical protein